MGNKIRTNKRTIRNLTLAVLCSLFLATICTAGLISCLKSFSGDQNFSTEELESLPCHTSDATEEPDCRCSEIGLEKDSHHFSNLVSAAPIKTDLLFYLSYLPRIATLDLASELSLFSLNDTAQIFSDSIRLLI